MKSVEVEPASETTSVDARRDLRQRPYSVLISYASPNRQNAFQACRWIEASGIRCWIAPRDIQPGAEWKTQIVDTIEQTKLVVLIDSTAAQLSKQVLREVDLAFEKERTIIPFRVEAVEKVTPAFQYIMAPRQWIDATCPPMKPHYKRLVKAVHKVIRT